jgi:hypothetical protein
MRHTPGPWKIETNTLGCKNITSGTEFFTCTEIGWTHGVADETEDVANAHLIAAAPDLLSALQNLTDFCVRVLAWDKHTTGRNFLLKDAQAAISKAIGEVEDTNGKS